MPKRYNEVEPQKSETLMTSSTLRERRQKRLEDEERELEELLNGEGEENGEEGKEEDPKEQEGQKEVEPSSPEERTFKKRYGDLRRHSQRVEEDLKKEIDKLKEQIESGNAKPPVGEDDLQKWVNTNPQVASIIEQIAERKAEERFSEAEERLQNLDEEQSKFTRSKSEAAIRKAHPEYDTLRNEDAFHDWAESQPKWIKDVVYVNTDDPDSVIRVIDLYKMDNNITTKDKKSKAKEAASAVKTSKEKEVTDEKPTFSESQVQKSSDAWFEKNEEAIKEAMREGRFEYDLSGAAR